MQQAWWASSAEGCLRRLEHLHACPALHSGLVSLSSAVSTHWNCETAIQIICWLSGV